MTEFLAPLPAAPAASLRPRNADDLGLRRALSDRLLPLLVAAMAFLAVLALGGAAAVRGLAVQWQAGAQTVLTVQVPRPDDALRSGETRAVAVGRALAAMPGVLTAHRLSAQEIDAAVAPWLGEDARRLSLTLPAVFEVRAGSPSAAAALAAPLRAAAEGTLVEANGVWFDRLAALAASLQACAALILGLVAFVAAAVVAVTTRAGIAARREAIEIVHALGATDGMIAGRFAARLTLLTFAGGVLGVLAAVPVLLGLAALTAPFQPGLPPGLSALAARLPAALWAGLATLPFAAAAIGWLTAHVTVRSSLSVLP
jgi:cell division transport system permease protein